MEQGSTRPLEQPELRAQRTPMPLPSAPRGIRVAEDQHLAVFGSVITGAQKQNNHETSEAQAVGLLTTTNSV